MYATRIFFDGPAAFAAGRTNLFMIMSGKSGWVPFKRMEENRKSPSSRYMDEERHSSNGSGDGAEQRNGSKVHIAVDTLGHLLALKVTAADRGDRE